MLYLLPQVKVDAKTKVLLDEYKANKRGKRKKGNDKVGGFQY